MVKKLICVSPSEVALALICENSNASGERTVLTRMNIPMSTPKSPMRLTTNALRPAFAYSSF